MNPLGKILKSRGLITEEKLEYLLNIQKHSGSRLGDIIISEGILTYLELYNAIAQHYDLTFVNLLKDPPDEKLLTCINAVDYINFQAMPWKFENDKIIIAIAEYSDETIKWLYDKYSDNFELVVTSPLDIRKTVERLYGKLLEDESKLSLWQQNPEISARVTASGKTKKVIYLFLISALTLSLIFPKQSSSLFISFCSISYFLSIIVKMYIFCVGCKPEEQTNWHKFISQYNDSSLPIYTILIPMYKEVASLPNMIAAMQAMDYPSEKLDIKLILEDDDEETINAAMALKPTYNFEIIRVPYSTLRTKPKACNYALRYAKGEYVTVFDADDIPEPLQLKKAIAVFRNSPDSIICLQARLNYYNADTNWLTHSFSLEYSALFNIMLRGLSRLRIPLPLSGTSNHISLSHLRELGEWDAYNVTEDADLGIRLGAQGFKTAMLDSYTMEESTMDIPAWLRQRSRWIKGYMQTWLVHMRNPILLYKKLGFKSFCGFQFFIGFSSFTFLTAPILWLFVLLYWLLPPYLVADWLPSWLLWLSLNNFFLNVIIHWVMMLYCVSRKKKPTYQYKIAALLYPFYLTLHSIASYKALYQLIVKPHFWEKTTHGFSKTIKNHMQAPNITTNNVDCPILIRI